MREKRCDTPNHGVSTPRRWRSAVVLGVRSVAVWRPGPQGRSAPASTMQAQQALSQRDLNDERLVTSRGNVGLGRRPRVSSWTAGALVVVPALRAPAPSASGQPYRIGWT